MNGGIPHPIIKPRDRVHRIGQKKNVSIYKLRAKDTVEEYIKDILSEKKKSQKM